GETAVMPDSRSSTPWTSIQLSIGRSACGRGSSSTSCVVPAGTGAMRLTSRGASTRRCDWVPSVRSMMFSCSPAISAVTNTITATPTAMPTRISSVCARPWRRKRMAMVDSIHIGSVELDRQFAAARVARLGRGLCDYADAVAFGGHALRIQRAGSHHPVALLQAFEHFGHGQTAQAQAHLDALHPALAHAQRAGPALARPGV